jgi:hypothetical protein
VTKTYGSVQASAGGPGVEDEITEQRSIGVTAHVQSGVS